MSWDAEEVLFRAVRGAWRAVAGRPGPRLDDERAVRLPEIEARLLALAQTLAGRRLLLKPAETVGGVRGVVLLLPAVVDVGTTRADALEHSVLRTVISARIAATPADDTGGSPAAGRDGLSATVDALLAARAAIDALCVEWPGFAARHAAAVRREFEVRTRPARETPREAALEDLRRALAEGLPLPDRAAVLARLRALPHKGPARPGFLLWGEAPAATDLSLADAAMAAADLAVRPPDGDERIAPPRDAVERIFLPKTEEIEPLPMHTFEKIETLEAFKGGLRKLDGDDELEEHLEALSEVDLRQVLRGGDDVHGIYRADVDLSSDIPDVSRAGTDERGIPYDEWDARRGVYRSHWTTVYPVVATTRAPGSGAEAARRNGRTIRTLLRRLEAERTRFAHVDRQLEGDDVDLDALVDEHGLRQSGHDAPGRVYVRRERRQRDVATTLLLDISLSAQSWVENRCVLDVSRDAAVVLGEVAAKLGDALEILAFASNTRNLCRVFTLKAFDDPWFAVRDRLGALAPQGYTRVGPALRHATAGLRGRPERHRMLMLVTDGKPTDYDRYEGAYGIADVRQAVREAARDGIVVHALGIDPRARGALPAMFGPGGWEVVRHVGELPAAVTTAYGKLRS
ncbi:VWA domain-containing protein [Myxococcota bacterium]|nr:VWA domain-containing protein [Myxococcota bacterium]